MLPCPIVVWAAAVRETSGKTAGLDDGAATESVISVLVSELSLDVSADMGADRSGSHVQAACCPVLKPKVYTLSTTFGRK